MPEQVWSAMQAAGVAPDTGTFLALARMEGLRGDPDASLNWVKTSLSKGMSMQLRMVHPALVGYCIHRNSAAALQLDAFLTEQVISWEKRNSWKSYKGRSLWRKDRGRSVNLSECCNLAAVDVSPAERVSGVLRNSGIAQAWLLDDTLQRQEHKLQRQPRKRPPVKMVAASLFISEKRSSSRRSQGQEREHA
ncbi:hypothetical protein DUNSADRAFT_6393 [Dunaliella salina]|uniref:Uncharacterized protein n=1 Tax=Dunaliella salina TaxID=3046 RepID=A0ABQ7H6Q9_DUNSA|nr:hypothetical protein DUNSADRAFT_6393 [Dunaliella salina]|eukprot:KAF5842543.1 hypothetical protein DUNSADRAFT_6393 [Dunaliella salina]